MLARCMVAMLLLTPFWETKPPREWSDAELRQLLRDSPWAQTLKGPPPVQVHLATAEPVRMAEAELARRSKTEPSATAEEYADFLRTDSRQHIVLAVAVKAQLLSDAEESRRTLNETAMHIGRKKYKVAGHFAPTPSDPFLRLIFPREIPDGAKAIAFDIYVPGVPFPYRQVEFRLSELMYKGKLEL